MKKALSQLMAKLHFLFLDIFHQLLGFHAASLGFSNTPVDISSCFCGKRLYTYVHMVKRFTQISNYSICAIIVDNVCSVWNPFKVCVKPPNGSLHRFKNTKLTWMATNLQWCYCVSFFFLNVRSPLKGMTLYDDCRGYCCLPCVTNPSSSASHWGVCID